MFETIVSKIANVIRKTIRVVEAGVRREPLLASATVLLAILFFLF